MLNQGQTASVKGQRWPLVSIHGQVEFPPRHLNKRLPEVVSGEDMKLGN